MTEPTNGPAYATPARHTAVWPRRLPATVQIPETTLWFNLEVSARRYPAKAAYSFFGRTLAYASLLDQAERLAGWLQAQGVAKGDRVLLFMQNCPQFVVALYAIVRADAVVVPVNPMNRADEFGHYISDPAARVCITSADLAAVVHEANQRLPEAERLAHVVATRYADAMPAEVPAADRPAEAVMQWLTADPPLPEAAPGGATITRWLDAIAARHLPGAHTAQPDDLVLLPYTSGTTGLPKGCLHSHRTLMANVVGGGIWGHASAETVSLGVVPMFHITGMMYTVLSCIYLGSTVVLLPRWDRELAASLIQRWQTTHWVCIPTMIIDLFGSPNYKRFDLSSLRYLSGGGAAMPHAVAERLQTEYGIAFAEGYGLTETAAPSHGNPPERPKLQCLGIPIFGVDSRVVDPKTLEEVPIGETGEIVTSGPMVFKGYWRHPEATERAFFERGGQRYFRTGDLGRMDEDGYFFMVDRLKRMINASGFKVWPSEVELLLFKCPLIQEACIIATRDAYRGETVKAVVVLRAEVRDSATAEDIIGWAREHMAAYKVPRVVEFTDALPESGAGKVLWRVLQERENAASQS